MTITLTYSALIYWALFVVVVSCSIGAVMWAHESKAPNDRRSAAFAEGRESALEVLADTDENAAIIEWISTGKLAKLGEAFPHHTMRHEHDRPEQRWFVSDPTLRRANLNVEEPSPREAYRKALKLRGAALAICEQLDTIKEA